jgi:two-component system nitrogen regulation response regulator GlnG
MTGATILVADDDRSIRTVLDQALGRLGYEVQTTGNAATLWRWVNDGRGDLIITDVVMPDEDGLDLIPRIRKIRPELRVIAMSAQNTLLTAVKAAERGAFEYLPKPFDLNELVGIVRRALTERRSAAATEQEGSEVDEQLPLIGRSPAMQEIYRVLARLMGTDLTVMIAGESGTGKELVARALHQYGKRRNGPFVAINMAAIPRELVESELFGHEKGAFTGAAARSAGRFEQAEGGTLFLDERDPPRPAPARQPGPVPGGPVLPAQRGPDPAPSLARADRGHPRPGPALPRPGGNRRPARQAPRPRRHGAPQELPLAGQRARARELGAPPRRPLF